MIHASGLRQAAELVCFRFFIIKGRIGALEVAQWAKCSGEKAKGPEFNPQYPLCQSDALALINK